jgi:hypothetical protein
MAALHLPPFGTYSSPRPYGHQLLAFFFSVFSFEKIFLGRTAEKEEEKKSFTKKTGL